LAGFREAGPDPRKSTDFRCGKAAQAVAAGEGTMTVMLPDLRSFSEQRGISPLREINPAPVTDRIRKA